MPKRKAKELSEEECKGCKRLEKMFMEEIKKIKDRLIVNGEPIEWVVDRNDNLVGGDFSADIDDLYCQIGVLEDKIKDIEEGKEDEFSEDDDYNDYTKLESRVCDLEYRIMELE